MKTRLYKHVARSGMTNYKAKLKPKINWKNQFKELFTTFIILYQLIWLLLPRKIIANNFFCLTILQNN